MMKISRHQLYSLFQVVNGRRPVTQVFPCEKEYRYLFDGHLSIQACFFLMKLLDFIKEYAKGWSTDEVPGCEPFMVFTFDHETKRDGRERKTIKKAGECGFYTR